MQPYSGRLCVFRGISFSQNERRVREKCSSVEKSIRQGAINHSSRSLSPFLSRHIHTTQHKTESLSRWTSNDQRRESGGKRHRKKGDQDHESFSFFSCGGREIETTVHSFLFTLLSVHVCPFFSSLCTHVREISVRKGDLLPGGL